MFHDSITGSITPLYAGFRSIKFVHEHRYAIIGENGVGKSTLLRRIAKQSVPGIPLHFRFGYVQQELPVAEDMQVLDYILKGVKSSHGNLEERLAALREEEDEVGNIMEVSDILRCDVVSCKLI